ncbi:MAG: hypothetical protein Q8R79_06245 [Legionellaceae bacterium]|nr:hypothetical protein [Legionellaceae bacterium]
MHFQFFVSLIAVLIINVLSASLATFIFKQEAPNIYLSQAPGFFSALMALLHRWYTYSPPPIETTPPVFTVHAESQAVSTPTQVLPLASQLGFFAQKIKVEDARSPAVLEDLSMATIVAAPHK